MKAELTRRGFLKTCTAGCLAGAGLAAGIPIHAQAQQALSGPADVWMIEGDPEKTVAAAFDVMGGIQTWIRPGSMVILKPNISFPNPPEWGGTTNPKVVAAVARAALNAGASRVLVMDRTMREPELCLKRTGLEAALDTLENVKWIPLDQQSAFEEVAVSGGKALQSVKIPKLLLRPHVLINLPCAKSHTATDVSFGLKNLMGLIWDREYFHSSTDLHTAIAELATVIRPSVTLLDATRALVTNGPSGPGKVADLNMLIAGTDVLAVDAAAVSLADWNNRAVPPQAISHLVRASEAGLGKLQGMNIQKRAARS
jgi:uncharacterized protein (DUF362 family)